MDRCPPPARLREEPGHLASCSECRETLDALDLLEAPETEEERRVLDALTGDPRRVLSAARLRAGPDALRIRRRPLWVVGSAIAAACAAAVALAIVRRPADPAAVVRGLQGESRPLEVAVSDLPWAPYQPRRGAQPAALDPALRKLMEAAERERPGARRALAMVYLLRGGPGDLQRANAELSRAPGGPRVDNDRGVLLSLEGDPLDALEFFLRAGAKFNAALMLEKLGARERAAQLFDGVAQEKTQWSAEAAQRAAALRVAAAPPAPSPRRENYLALLAAATPAQLAEAQKTAPPDYLALSARLTAGQLPEHARLYRIYRSLREHALTKGDVREVEEFARLPAVQQDPLLWAPALQLAGYLHAVRGDWREAQRYQASLLDACKVRGCTVENEAIALDELADLAGRDGDYASAHRLQDRAEQLFRSVGATLQLGELQRKRAALFNEENHPDQAAQSVTAALRQLAGVEQPALASLLELASQIEAQRGGLLAARELGEAALQLAKGNRDLEVDIAALLATNAVELGRPDEARARLETEIARLGEAGHQSGVAALRRRLAEVRLRQGDAAGALAEAERGLQLAPAGSWEWDRVALHLAHGRALRALGREAEAQAELSQALEAVARDVTAAPDPAAYLSQARGLLAEVALEATSADALALPLDRLRAAALHVAPAQAGWSRALPAGVCVLVVIPGDRFTLQAVARREGGEVRRLAPGPAELATGTDGCDELWMFAGPPLDALDLPAATGIATTLTRLLAPEPRSPPRSALFVTAETRGDVAAVATALPGAERERAALAKLSATTELSGERATPEEALRLAPGAALLHFAVHGFEGRILQLAGEGGRLAARDIAQAHLQPDARVVLSSCEAGTPGPGGVAWAFARAGAVAVAAARGEVGDAAAARWSERFFQALGAGQPFARAAREAGQEDRAARFIVVK